MHTKIKYIVEKRWGEERGVVGFKKPCWPHEGELVELQQELKRSLFSEFDPAYMDDDLSASALSNLASRSLSPLILIRHNIYADRWSKSTKELIVWYLGYWSAMKNNPSGPQFLVFLNIIYPGTRVGSRWKIWPRSNRVDKELIQKDVAQIITSQKLGCPCLILKELIPPKQHDVGDWFSRHNIYDVKMQTEYLTQIFGPNSERISMADIEHELQKIHESFLKLKGYV